MKYLIREMTPSDIDDVIVGEESVFGESLGFDLLYTELKLNPYAFYFVLEIDKEVKGYIGTWIEGERGEIVNFYVDKEYQGMGFGQMLLSFYLELAKMSGVKNVSLEVRASNNVAISLYEKNGFKFSHKREKYYKNGEDALVLIKEL